MLGEFFLDLLIPFNLQTLSLSGMMIFIEVYFQGRGQTIHIGQGSGRA